MIRLSLFKIRAFSAGNAGTVRGALAQGGLQFMLIIWLQGIWLPLHGYDYADTRCRGIVLPLTARFPRLRRHRAAPTDRVDRPAIAGPDRPDRLCGRAARSTVVPGSSSLPPAAEFAGLSTATEIMPAKSRRASTRSRESRLMPTLSKYRSISGSASEIRATVPVSPSWHADSCRASAGRHVAVGGRDRIAVRIALRIAQLGVDAVEHPVRDGVLEHLGLVVHLVPAVAEHRGPGRSPSAGACAPSPARPSGPPRSASRRRTSRGRRGPGRRACGWTPTRCWPTPRSARRASWCSPSPATTPGRSR